MIRRVLFFVAAPFTRRDYERYGMEIFAGNGLDIAVWDLTPLLYPEVAARVAPLDVMQWDRVVSFASEDGVLAALAEYGRETFVFTSVPLDGHTLPIFRAMTQQGIRYGVNVVNAIPPVSVNGARQAFLARLRRITPRKVLSLAARKLPLSVFGVAPATLILVEGRRCSTARPEVTSRTQLVPSHTLDYNNYVAAAVPRSEDGTVVFLDNYMTAHPDFVYVGEQPPVSAQRWHAAMRRLFDAVESQLGLRVVIAAHPRSAYEPAEAPFGDREIIKGATPSLVAKASLVLLNHSTSLSYAVLYRKPLAFVTSDEFAVSKYAPYVTEYSQLLRQPAVNADRFTDLGHLRGLAVDEAAYCAYEADYISMPGAAPVSSWQILCDVIKTIR